MKESKKRKKLRIGITMGDVSGIGPELVIRAFDEPGLREICTPVVYGSPRVLNIYRKALSIEKFSYNVIQHPSQAQPRKVSVIDVPTKLERVEIGQPSEIGGQLAFEALEMALKDIKEGELDALVTLPIDKATIQQEKFKFPGHTEYLTKSDGAEDSLMFMIGEGMRVGVVTGHVPVKDISANLSVAKILSKIKIMDKSLRQDFNLERPRIAVLGLNPHAGDNGLLGKEDREYVAKAVQLAVNEKMMVLGPYPADGFFGAGTYAKFDGILAMYHDQGLIPFKLVSGFNGVNYTAGLSFIRTSPDHGVAYGLAGKNEARMDSFIQAIYAAIDIFRARDTNLEIGEDAMQPLSRNSLRKKTRNQPPRDSGRPEREDRNPRPEMVMEEELSEDAFELLELNEEEDASIFEQE